MNLTQSATTIDRPAPATFTCAPQQKIWEDATAEAQPGDIIRKPFCPIARVVGKENLKDGRVCLVVTFPGCHDRHVEEWVLPAAEVTAVTAPAPAVTRAPSKPAAASHAATTAAVTRAPAAIGENDEPPNRGYNGRGRVQPIAAKKLLPLIVPISRIRSDIPASNFDPNELEILGELMLSIGGFVVPPVLVRDSGGYRVVSGHLQFHAAVLAKQLNPRAGETIPAIVLESENQTTASAMLKMLKFAA